MRLGYPLGMRASCLALAITACCPSPVAPASAPPALTADPTRLEAVAWLAGSWLSDEDGQRTEEHWGEPRGATMMATNRTVVDGATVHHEFLMLAVDEGGLVLRAMPAGQPAAEFRAKELGAVESAGAKVVFENPAHDYPQRIIYQRLPDGTLLTRIEGTREGKLAASEWRWERVRP